MCPNRESRRRSKATGDGETGGREQRGDGEMGRGEEDESSKFKRGGRNGRIAPSPVSPSPRHSVSPSPRLPLSVIIAGGGTGGHIYPGIAIAQEFRRRDADRRFFCRHGEGLETKIVPREGFGLELIEVAALKRVGASPHQVAVAAAEEFSRGSLFD